MARCKMDLATRPKARTEYEMLWRKLHPQILGTLFGLGLVAGVVALSVALVPRVGASEGLKDPDLLKREQMVALAKELGVTCNYCHDVSHFRDGSKHEYQIGLAHIKMVAELNQRKTAGLGQVSCILCHRGHAKIDPVFRGAVPTGPAKGSP